MNKKVLITGITGMVGSHLADYLFEYTDWEIYGLCRWRSSLDNLDNLIKHINKKKRVTLLMGDLRDSNSINNIVEMSKPDYVFHLAAQSFPQTSFTSADDTYDTNIQGTERLLNALKKYSKKAIIHICSSSEVFGRVPKEKIPIDENCSFHPASPYAISKIGTDMIARFYAEAYDMMVMSTRMFTHTGPRRGDIFAESSFAKQIAMIEQGLIKPIIYVGNLDSKRTIADVRDAVRAYHMLLTINPIAGEYYNIGGEKVTTIGELLNYLISLTSMKNQIKIEIDKSRLRPIDADLQIPNTTKFRNHTGWKPQIKFEKTMHDLLEYWRHKVKTNPQNILLR